MAGAIAVRGLRELNRDFKKISKSLSKEIRKELAEVGKPVAERTTRYMEAGGGGFPRMRGVAGRSAYVSEMRVGATAKSVYVAPAWNSNKGTLQGQILALQIRWRMEAALEDEADNVSKGLEKTLDHLFDRNGF